MKTFNELSESLKMSEDDAYKIATKFVDLANKYHHPTLFQSDPEGRKIINQLKQSGWWISNTQGKVLLRHATNRDFSKQLPNIK